ncbi:hypothetical protein JKP88DRAFT_291670 [Tribonema minus]|uniref:Glutathione S-transferase n=1 Tax=Tribonema minus TaxID=303371 RepID=A0A836CPN8_9STRA|nr:hypothetical protein JKP88DRAFT_291670 [Tribonema minus]
MELSQTTAPFLLTLPSAQQRRFITAQRYPDDDPAVQFAKTHYDSKRTGDDKMKLLFKHTNKELQRLNKEVDPDGERAQTTNKLYWRRLWILHEDNTSPAGQRARACFAHVTMLTLSQWLLTAWRFMVKLLGYAMVLQSHLPRPLCNLFSHITNGPYSPARNDAVLLSLAYSHYCEKARWVLDLCQESYEEICVPACSVRLTAKLNGSKAAFGTLPLVVATVDGERAMLPDSGDVTAMLCESRQQAWLYPMADARALETYFSDQFGLPAFRAAYFYMLSPATCEPRVMAAITARGYLLIAHALSRAPRAAAAARFMRLEAQLPSNLEAVDAAFALVERRLREGGPYLCGAELSAADIAFASLAYPMVLPPEQAHRFIARESPDLPEAYARIVDRYRATPAGQFALRVYAHNRHSRAPLPP